MSFACCAQGVRPERHHAAEWQDMILNNAQGHDERRSLFIAVSVILASALATG
jgi:hypothetical protein